MVLKNIFLIFTLLFVKEVFGQQPKLRIPIGHTGEVTAAEFSPDGTKVVTRALDGTAKLWETASGKLLHDFKTGGDASATIITDAMFSNDSRFVFIKYEGEELIVWDINSGELVWDWSGTPAAIPFRYIKDAISPDGKRTVFPNPDYSDTITKKNAPVVYDNKTKKPLFTLVGHKGDISSATFSPDGKYIITVGTDRTVKQWSLAGKLVKNFVFKNDTLELLRFFPDGKKIFLLENGLPKILDIITGKQNGFPVIKEKPYERTIYKLSPDGKFIAALSGYYTEDFYKAVERFESCIVWDVQSGKELFRKNGIAEHEKDELFSTDGKKMLFISADSSVKIVNPANGQLIYKLGKFKNAVDAARFSPDGEKIFTYLSDSSATLWDVVTKKLNPVLKAGASEIKQAQLSEDGRYILNWDKADDSEPLYDMGQLKNFHESNYGNGPGGIDSIIVVFRNRSLSVWNATNGKLIAGNIGSDAMINDANFSPDGRSVVMACADRTAKLWDLATGKFTSEYKGRSQTVTDAWFSRTDGTKLVIVTDQKREIINFENGQFSTIPADDYDIETEMPFRKRPAEGSELNNESIEWISPDNSMGIGWGADILMLLPANKNGEELLKGISPYLGPLENSGRMEAGIRNAIFSPDSRKIVVVLSDNTTKIFDVEKGRFISTIIIIDSTDYINQLSEGYYQCTPNAAKQLYYIGADGKVISFEQLDVKYNRPDKVLEAFGNLDESLTVSYYNAYIKRVEKLGIDTTVFRDGYSIPATDIINKDAILREQKNEKLALHIKGLDSVYTLDRFNVWINEVPLFGMRGLSLKNRNKKYFDTTFSVQLSAGENRIEASVRNINGIESYRKPLSVNYTPQKNDDSKVYFIGVGNNRFADSSNNLKWCVQDIRDLAITLKEKYGDKLIIVDTLFDEKATRTNVHGLKTKLLKTNVEDKVIFSFSGHGLLSKDYDYYLSSYSVNFNDPEQGGIPYEEIENMLDSIPARKKILLLDACHSGEVDKEEMKKIEAASKVLAKNNTSINPGNRGVKVVNIDSAKIGLQNSFELMQSLFVNVGKGTGAVIISASGGVQFAQERSELGHGVFTYSVIEAMQKFPSIKVSELKKYIGDRVMELTNGLQKPTTRNETIAVDWNVW